MVRVSLGLGALLLSLAAAAPSDPAIGVDFEAVTEASAIRQTLGLEGDREYVSALMGSSTDVGSGTWGVPMTAAEDGAIDLLGRMTWADRIDDEVLRILRKDGDYGGAFFDPSDGSLTLLLVAPSETRKTEVASTIPASNYRWAIKEVPRSEADLVIALEGAPAVWESIGDLEAIGFGLDVVNNGIFVELATLDAKGVDATDLLSSRLGIPVRIILGEQGSDTHCTSRDHCHGPMRAGINVYRGFTGSNWPCTMGFHIVRPGNDYEFLTAGHCGAFTPNSWFHPAFASSIGSELQSLYADGGQDIMRVSMTNAQVSDNIYNDSTDIIGSGTPVAGETLCASLGWGSNQVKCGIVQTTLRTWESDTVSPTITMWGGDMSYSTVDGDSGSPVYRRIAGGTGDQARAIGINDHEDGYFARLYSSLDDFGATVFQ